MFHRIGGAVRRIIAGVTLPRTPHHQAAPSDLTQAARGNPDSPTPPRRPRTPRRRPAAPPAASPEAPARRGWFTRWFGRRPRPAAPPLPPFPDSEYHNTPFTRGNHPGLSAKARDFFNTRIEDCDSQTLRLVLAVIAVQVAESLPPELRTDPRAIIAAMWDRLREPSDQAVADAAPDEATGAAPDAQPGDAPANPAETTPDTQPCDAPARPADAEPQASSPPPAPLPPAPVPAAPDSVAAAADPPCTAALPRPDRPSRTRRRHRGRRLGRTARRRLRCCRPLRGRGRRESPPGPPPRRLCYAACAGPP